MDLFFYYFNLRLKDARNNDSYHLNKSFKSKFHLAKIIRPDVLFRYKNLYEIRQFEIEGPSPQILIKNAGWHFSNLGSPERVWDKLRAFSHWGECIFSHIGSRFEELGCLTTERAIGIGEFYNNMLPVAGFDCFIQRQVLRLLGNRLIFLGRNLLQPVTG